MLQLQGFVMHKELSTRTLALVIVLILIASCGDPDTNGQGVVGNGQTSTPTYSSTPTLRSTSERVKTSPVRVTATATATSAPPPQATQPPARESVTTVAGNAIPLPANLRTQNSTGDPVTLIQTADPPLISQEEAMQAVADHGFPWGLGGRYAGKPVSVEAWYGLGTIGRSGAHGWLGPLNIRLSNGEILDHIEDRPIWLIDYSNVPQIMSSGSGNPTEAVSPSFEPDTPRFGHTVYAVDAKTRSVIWIASYSENDSD